MILLCKTENLIPIPWHVFIAWNRKFYFQFRKMTKWWPAFDSEIKLVDSNVVSSLMFSAYRRVTGGAVSGVHSTAMTTWSREMEWLIMILSQLTCCQPQSQHSHTQQKNYKISKIKYLVLFICNCENPSFITIKSIYNSYQKKSKIN